MVSTAILKRFSQEVSRIAGQFSGDNLRARCARGGLILTIAVALGRGMQLVRYMVLTRLLMPAELGTMAIVLASTLFFETVFEVGVKQSVIQNKRGAEPGYLNTAWWFQAVRGLGLFVVAFLAAPAVSWFYGKGELTALLRVALFALVLRGFISPGAHVLEKKFFFGKSAVLIQGSSLLGTLLTITLAIVYRDIWALVAGFVSESFLRFLISFLLCPFRPRFSVERESMAEIIRFARGMLGLPVLTLVAFQTPIFVLGKLVPFSLVGIYAMAEQLARTPREFFVKIFFPVMLPAFSELQADKRSIRAAVLKMTGAVAVLGLPFTMFCAGFSGAVLSVVFGSQYAAASVAFAFLSVCALMRTQGVTLASVYLALGRPDLHRSFVALRAVILVLLIYPGIVLFGLAGAAAIAVIAELCGLVTQVVFMKERIGLGLGEYLSCWRAGAALSVPVVISAVVMKLIGAGGAAAGLLAGGTVCLVCCLTGLILLKGGADSLKVLRVQPQKSKEDFEEEINYA